MQEKVAIYFLLLGVCIGPIFSADVTVSRPAASNDSETSIIIVAGQSNMLNWHADAELLPPDANDENICFYYETGAPPNHPNFEFSINSSSHGKWTKQESQRQDPFVKYNRVFFGPEITLARSLSQSGIDSLAVFKMGYFGTSLAEDWNNESDHGNQLYKIFQHHLLTAIHDLELSKGPTKIIGLFWIQGETDARKENHARSYEKNLRRFITSFRNDTHLPKLPIVIARIGSLPRKGYKYPKLIRGAQKKVAETTPFTTWVDTDDLPRDSDKIHLTAPGVMSLGERLADAFLNSELTPDTEK
jgi:hypothetical protein